MRLPHAIQYQGSKRLIAPQILRFVPPGTRRLVEPFAGSAALSVAVAAQQRAQAFWINDLNPVLVRLLQRMVEAPQALADAYEAIWQAQHGDSLAHYYQVREQFNRSQAPEQFLYLLARCVKGSVRYNDAGQFNQSPDKRRLGTQPQTMRANIFGVSQLLGGCTQFSSEDYRSILKKARAGDVVYMDPPYQGVCGDRDARYFAGISHQDFVLALEDLTRRGIDYLVSYDGSCGDKQFGQALPPHLGLHKTDIRAGRSSQATLLGREEITVESLYISRSIMTRLGSSAVRPAKQSDWIGDAEVAA